jgi:hydroxymethylpyrimidine pyrophosphatase-like HAD family hydrolase
VWSTGRSPRLFRELWDEAPLLTPDVLICSVGSEVFYRDPFTGEFVEDKAWARRLDMSGRWKRAQIETLAKSVKSLAMQQPSEQRPHKISFHAPEGELGIKAVAKLRSLLDTNRLTEDVAKIVYSGGKDVDVLSAAAGKGRALEAVREALFARAGGGKGGGGTEGGGGDAAAASEGGGGGASPAAAAKSAGGAGPGAKSAAATPGGGASPVPANQQPPGLARSPSLSAIQPWAPDPLPLGLQVSGDSGNDAELFEVEGARGCVVANAHDELLEYYRAWQREALEGEPVPPERRQEALLRQAEGLPPPLPEGRLGALLALRAAQAKNLPRRLYLSTEPCAAGILEALRTFGMFDKVTIFEAKEMDERAVLELVAARRTVVDALCGGAAAAAAAGPASSSLGGAGSVGGGSAAASPALSPGGPALSPGGTANAVVAAASNAMAVLSDGRVVPFSRWDAGRRRRRMVQPVEWADNVRVRHIAEGLVLATFERWGWDASSPAAPAPALASPAKPMTGKLLAAVAAAAAVVPSAAAAAPAVAAGRRAGPWPTSVLMRRVGTSAAACTMEVLHLHESTAATSRETVAAQLDALVKKAAVGAE